MLAFAGFSALQRAEIAEMGRGVADTATALGFSALQRAEIAEMARGVRGVPAGVAGFSALQRAEIAEMHRLFPPLHRHNTFQCSSTSRNC